MKRSFLKVTQLVLVGFAVCGLVVPTLAIEGIGQPSTVTVEYVNAITGEPITDEQGVPITTTVETKDETITIEAENISGYKVVGDTEQTQTIQAKNNVARIGYLPDDSSSYRNYRVEYVLSEYKEPSRNGEFIADPVVYTNVDTTDVNTEPAKVDGFTYVKTETAQEDSVWVIKHLYKSAKDSLPNSEGSYKLLAYDENKTLMDITTGKAPLKNSKVGAKKYKDYELKSPEQIDLILSHKTPNKTVEVNYNYTGSEPRAQQGTVTINYVDAVTKEPIDTKEVLVDFGEEVPVEIPALEGYDVITTDVKVTTTLINPTVTIEVECKKVINGTTTIKTVLKETGEEISKATTQTHKYAGEYQIQAPTLIGYTLIGDLMQTVNVTEEAPNNTITFYYKKNVQPVTKGTITIEYRDLTGKKIIEDEVLTDVPLGTQLIKAKQIEGYELASEAQKSVEVTKQNLNPVVVFEYSAIPTGDGTLTPDVDNKPTPPEKFSGSIVVRYVDTEGNLICAEERYSSLEEGNYSYTAKSFDGYVLESNQKLSFILNADNPSKVVEFVYRRADINGKISILFIDNETGETIQTSQIYNGLGAGVYTYSAPNISGYRLVSNNKVSTELAFGRNSANIVFRYSKIASNQNNQSTQNNDNSRKGVITLKYIDEETNNEIKDAVVYSNLELKDYTYSAIDITGYELVSETDQKVTLDSNNSSKEIVFKYKKSDSNATAIVDTGSNNSNGGNGGSGTTSGAVNKDLNSIQSLPMSIKIIAIIGLVAFVLLVVSIIVRATSKKRRYMDDEDDYEDYNGELADEYL